MKRYDPISGQFVSEMYTAKSNGARTNTATNSSAGDTSSHPVLAGCVSDPPPRRRLSRRPPREAALEPAWVLTGAPDRAMVLTSSCGGVSCSDAERLSRSQLGLLEDLLEASLACLEGAVDVAVEDRPPEHRDPRAVRM